MKTILAPIDFSGVSDAVIEVAAQAAAAFSADVILLNVAPRQPDIFGYQLEPRRIIEPVPKDLTARHQGLIRGVERLRGLGVDGETVLIRGDRVATVLAEAKRLKADLIVMGSHGRGGLYRSLVGSVSEGVMRDASCPVLLVPARRLDVKAKSSNPRAA